MPLQGLFTAGAGEACCSPRCILMRLLYSAKNTMDLLLFGLLHTHYLYETVRYKTGSCSRLNSLLKTVWLVTSVSDGQQNPPSSFSEKNAFEVSRKLRRPVSLHSVFLLRDSETKQGRSTLEDTHLICLRLLNTPTSSLKTHFCFTSIEIAFRGHLFVTSMDKRNNYRDH